MAHVGGALLSKGWGEVQMHEHGCVVQYKQACELESHTLWKTVPQTNCTLIHIIVLLQLAESNLVELESFSWGTQSSRVIPFSIGLSNFYALHHSRYTDTAAAAEQVKYAEAKIVFIMPLQAIVKSYMYNQQ